MATTGSDTIQMLHGMVWDKGDYEARSRLEMLASGQHSRECRESDSFPCICSVEEAQKAIDRLSK